MVEDENKRQIVEVRGMPPDWIIMLVVFLFISGTIAVITRLTDILDTLNQILEILK